MSSLPVVTAAVVIAARSMAEKLRGLKRADHGLPWGWIIFGALVLTGIAIAIRLRNRRKDAEIDRDMLTARTMDRGFTDEEQDLMQRIADRQEDGLASDLVPRLRRYDEALEAFLAAEASGLSDEDRANLAETLASLRSKLGFQNMAEYREIPSTREVPVGTAMMSRPANQPDTALRAAVMHHVDELGLKIQFVADESPRDEENEESSPIYGPGDRLEFFFAHGPRRRCRFLARVTGPGEGRGRVFPMDHVKVENFAMTRPGQADIAVDGELRLPNGKAIPVVLLEITGNGARLSAPLPESVRFGTLTFRLPESKRPLEVLVARQKTATEEATPLERSRLRFRNLSEDTRQRIFRFIRRTAAPRTA